MMLKGYHFSLLQDVASAVRTLFVLKNPEFVKGKEHIQSQICNIKVKYLSTTGTKALSLT